MLKFLVNCFVNYGHLLFDPHGMIYAPPEIPECKKVLRRVITLLLHPTPTDTAFYLIVNVVVVVVKKCSLNSLKISDFVSDTYVMTNQIFKTF